MTTDLLALFYDIVRLEVELWNSVERRLRDQHDVALPWYEVMRVVDQVDSATVNDIARELAVTIGGVSKLVDRIEQAGYIRRAPHPTDGRSSLVALTASGKRLLRKLERTVDEQLAASIGTAMSSGSMARFGDDIRTLRLALAGRAVAD